MYNNKIIEKMKLPLMLFTILLMPLLCGDVIPLQLKLFFYTVSLLIKDLIVTLLPFIIFSFLFHSLISLKSGAISFVLILISMVAMSNFIAIMTGYAVGSAVLPLFDLTITKPAANLLSMEPLWESNLPKVISNEPGLIMGIILGVIFALKPNANIEKLAKKMNEISMRILKKGFLPILPVFILGFVFKLEHEHLLQQALEVYGPILFVVVGTQICYVFAMFMIASNMRFKTCCRYLKDMLPATFTGFTTISSAASMPVTIMCVEKNLHSLKMANTIVPATANIHTLGSAIGLTLLTLGTLIAFDHPMPNFAQFTKFAVYYTIAKFAVAGIPGGVVIVVSPLLEAYLGFNAEMIGLITAIYMLFDPFGTATNVTCNGAFAIIFSKLYQFKEQQVVAEALLTSH